MVLSSAAPIEDPSWLAALVLGDYFADAKVYARVQDQVPHVGADVMATILKRAADRGEACNRISPMVATLPADLYRHQIFLTRTPHHRDR